MTLFSLVVEASLRVAGTRSRKTKTAVLADCLRRLDASEVVSCVGFLCGVPRQGKIGLGYASVAEVTAVAADTPSWTVLAVDEVLTKIQQVRGSGSKAARQKLLAELLSLATEDEQQFLRRLLVGELRQGALEGLVLDGIAAAAELPSREVRRAVMLSGSAAEVAKAALTEGRHALERFSLQLFRPLQPMLAKPAGDLDEALSKLGRAALEWKLDGARIQVHRDGDDVAIFTRRLNDVTTALPEVVEVARGFSAKRFVLDGEVIALEEDRRPRPFQVTMRRFGRRLDVDRLRREIPVVPFFFDGLHLDGEDLLDLGGEERGRLIAERIPEEFRVPGLVTEDAEAAEEFFAAALASGHEGIMAKSLEAPYEAGRRGSGWWKVKPSHTLDLVVLGAEWGSGRRQGWLSNLHLGARRDDGHGFVMLGKTFKGMTDEMLAWQTEKLQELEISRDGFVVVVEPKLIVEIAFDGVQESPHYPAGMALRFARVKRYRPDKSADQCDTVAAVRAIHGGH